MDALVQRLRRSPGIPVSNPSVSYWTLPPSPIARHGAEPNSILPPYADVVIIGSGITGTSFARTLLDYNAQHGGEPLKVVMLEARDACSGATGRNGGHIAPILYAEYSDLKDTHGADMAKKIIRFRLSHFPEILATAKEEGLLKDSQCREVDAFDVFYDIGRYGVAKRNLAAYRQDLPLESADYRLHEGPEEMDRLQLSPTAVGCLSNKAGAIHPYRFVTGILSRLLHSYADNFHLLTQTPCTNISSPAPSGTIQLYDIATPRGVVQTLHVVHATNGWASHLLPEMRSRILPGRGVMTAQRPWKELGAVPPTTNTTPGPDGSNSWAGTRSFVFFPDSSAYKFDYLTQQPAPPSTSASPKAPGLYPPPSGELMLGGGFGHGGGLFKELGNADDRGWNHATGKYLSSVLGNYFANPAGAVAEDRVNATWGGILGISVDEKPWVGRIPEKISGRCVPTLRNPGERRRGHSAPTDVAGRQLARSQLAAPGEWIAAGYSGEGMTHAWMSGKALAYMVLGMDACDPAGIISGGEQKNMEGGKEVDVDEWLPEAFRISEARLESTGFEDLVASFLL